MIVRPGGLLSDISKGKVGKKRESGKTRLRYFSQIMNMGNRHRVKGKR